MKFDFLKSAAASIALATTIVISPAALADRIQYHGTECMTANVSQGELMSWNKDGLTNNAPISLFIICPINYDQRRLTTFTNPGGRMRVSVYYPASAPLSSVIECIVRQGTSTETNVAVQSDDQIFNLNMSFPVGNQNFPGIGDSDIAESPNFNLSSSDDATMHMLCLMPSGSTLRMYQLDNFGL